MAEVYKYENLHIGNFLLSIGYSLRELNYKKPALMNLLQQTPADRSVGDLFGALGGKFFIIEFKKDKKSINDELKKPQRKELIKQLSHDKKELIDISLRAHLLCYPNFTNNTSNFNLIPYLRGFERQDNNDTLPIQDLLDFVRDLIENNSNFGESYQNIDAYIKLLDECSCKEDKSGKKGGGNSILDSGIFLNFDEKEGIKYIVYNSPGILDLKLSLEQHIIEQKLTIEKNKSMGKSMGM